MLNNKWSKIVSKLEFAFQPIVNIKSGKLFGVEALLRNVHEAGNFYSIINLFDEAFHDGILYQLDLELRQKALLKYKEISVDSPLQLFYNIDCRVLYMPDFKHGNTDTLLSSLDLKKQSICFELSERITLKDTSLLNTMIDRYKSDGFDIAIDDFGTGVSGLQILYHADTTFIKLDRFYIQDIQKDAKKRLFCTFVINMAHIMGIKVIAEGVEEKEEYFTCKDIGFDLIQGYLIQKPKIDITKIRSSYQEIKDLSKQDKRSKRANMVDKDKIEYIEPLNIDTSLHQLFTYFKDNIMNTFVPIVDDLNRLQGVIYEKDIKKLSYSQYGLSIAKNDTSKTRLKKFITKTVSAELNWGVDKLLEIYNISENNTAGMFITKNNQYHGFIDLNNLLKLSYNRNLEIAKNQNPLTKLPGNKQIEDLLSNVFSNDTNTVYHLVYFDFNDFKPFNDSYGFRQGDRAILLFSDILQKNLNSDVFIAHVGGDDFFISFKETEYDKVYEQVAHIQKSFEDMAQSLYNEKDRAKGYIETKDRFGEVRQFKLLGVASAIIEIKTNIPKDLFDDTIGIIKKESKKSDIPIGTTLLV